VNIPAAILRGDCLSRWKQGQARDEYFQRSRNQFLFHLSYLECVLLRTMRYAESGNCMQSHCRTPHTLDSAAKPAKLRPVTDAVSWLVNGRSSPARAGQEAE